MQDTPGENPSLAWPRWRKRLLILLACVAAGSLIWNQLPRGGGYPTDMTRVGAGLPTLVLAFDMHYTGGTAVMALMNEIRADYAGRMEFLVANLGMPDGRQFANSHAAFDGTVLLFDAAGKRIGWLHQPGSVTELRQAIDQAMLAK